MSTYVDMTRIFLQPARSFPTYKSIENN